jgi:hypothetical protein
MQDDREHLRLLAIFHWIVAGIAVLIALFPVIHLVIGIGIINGSFPLDAASKGNPFPIHVMGWFFVVFACTWIVCSLAFAACLACAARNLVEHRHRTFCMVMAGLSCAFFPFGTALGVFTIVVLSRDSVRALFATPT